MTTSVGVGFSANRNPEEAGREAVRKALDQKGGGRADFLFVFATVGYNQEQLIAAIREAGSGAALSGCSGEGIITHDTVAETNFALAVMAISSDRLRFENICVPDLESGAGSAGRQLAEAVRPLLKGDALGCFVFADGLSFDFDPFREAFERTLQPDVRLPLYGGLAADNWTARRTYQYHDDRILSRGISAVLMSGSGRIASGISHGCVPLGTRHTITRSAGNIIYEIDRRPALEVLKEYVDGDWRDQWNKVSLNLCLGFRSPDAIREAYGDFVVRYMMGMDDEEGYVTIQSDVQDGTEFWIVRRDKELIKNGLHVIAQQIGQGGGYAARPALILHFECMGRGRVVFREQERAELIRSLQQQVGVDVPWIGFYTYGEIGPVSGFNCIHNFTAVVTAVF